MGAPFKLGQPATAFMSRWVQVDCRDMSWEKARRHLCLARIPAKKGDLIEIVSTLGTLREDLGAWCRRLGDSLVGTEHHGEVFVGQVRVSICLTD